MPLFKRRLVLILLGVVLFGLLANCQSTPTLVSPSGPGISVGITGDGCPQVDIQVGQQVVWTNQDTQDHVVRHLPGDGEPQFDSGILTGGDSFSFTFIQPGEFIYECTLNEGPPGTVTVGP